MIYSVSQYLFSSYYVPGISFMSKGKEEKEREEKEGTDIHVVTMPASLL